LLFFKSIFLLKEEIIILNAFRANGGKKLIYRTNKNIIYYRQIAFAIKGKINKEAIKQTFAFLTRHNASPATFTFLVYLFQEQYNWKEEKFIPLSRARFCKYYLDNGTDYGKAKKELMAFGLFYKTEDELEFSPYYSRAPIYILDLEKASSLE
jgi:hypothetical protein